MKEQLRKPQHVIRRPEHDRYVVDARPLCQGMPFVLTDVAHPRLVLKHGSHFLVMDESAQVPACNTLGYGYYRYDTRHIAQWEIYLNDAPLSLLSRSVEKGYAGSFIYTNPEVGGIPQQKIMVNREVVVSDLLWERLIIENFAGVPHGVELLFKFQSDFADMFEVRGLNRPVRGERMVPISGNDGHSLFLAYRGLDGSLFETIISFHGLKPDSIHEGEVVFRLDLGVRQPVCLETSFTPRWDGKIPLSGEPSASFKAARDLAERQHSEWRSRSARVESGHELFNLLIDRGIRDIYILRQQTPKGYGLAAGVPWYSAVFGRDSAITASQVIPFMPSVARECIEVLAAYQGKREDTFKAERPGRIMHELRLGELARTNQIPHTPYYGTVDATQLWLMLFCEYVHWTGDLEFAERLWPSVKQAVAWLDRASEGGYIRYRRESPQGLENQGWKDSGDSVMHDDGELAMPPIALCEAQGYLYAARRELAVVAELLGRTKFANKLRADAAQLKTMFEKDFWLEDEQFLALALDRDDRKVRVLSSNPGHCLWTGIIDGERALQVADRLMSGELHSGWGVRTLSSSCIAYNPMSYHNGSVWPHDNAIIADGFRKVGRISYTHKIMHSMFEAAGHHPGYRLPELFCGFEREDGQQPISYPVSCSPQAWAAGAIFQMVKSCINFQPDACHKRLRIIEPSLPEWLGEVTIEGLQVGDAVLDLRFTAQVGESSCQILRKRGDVRVIVES